VVNPCPTCTSGDACPCPLRLRWEATLLPPDPPECLICLDTAQHLEWGEDFWWLAPRIRNHRGQPFNATALAKHLDRCGRADLIPDGAYRRKAPA
jgi:hypothetical protein